MTRKLSLKKKKREKKAVKLHFKPLFPGGQRPFTTMSPLRPGIFQNPPIWVSIDMDPAMRKSSPPAVHRAKSPSSLNSPCGFIPSASRPIGMVRAVNCNARPQPNRENRDIKAGMGKWESKWQSGSNQVVYRRGTCCPLLRGGYIDSFDFICSGRSRWEKMKNSDMNLPAFPQVFRET